MTTKTNKPITKEQIKPGLRCRQIAHPEFGDWRVDSHCAGATWNVSRWDRAGSIAVCEAELTKYWMAS